jgi:hypothetical protein
MRAASAGTRTSTFDDLLTVLRRPSPYDDSCALAVRVRG